MLYLYLVKCQSPVCCADSKVLFLCIETVVKIEGKYDIVIRQEELQGGTFSFKPY